MLTAVYPGTFDPFTNGHEDIVRRAASVFGRVIVGIADSKAKQPFFTVAERVEIAREVLAPLANVEVTSFSSLLMDFARARGRASSCGGCAPCRTSSTSSRWRG